MRGVMKVARLFMRQGYLYLILCYIRLWIARASFEKEQEFHEWLADDDYIPWGVTGELLNRYVAYRKDCQNKVGRRGKYSLTDENTELDPWAIWPSECLDDRHYYN